MEGGRGRVGYRARGERGGGGCRAVGREGGARIGRRKMCEQNVREI